MNLTDDHDFTPVGALKPVSAVIKVCALDAPFLQVTLPHMIRQAKYPFAETILVVDPRTTFTGKYALRNASVGSTFRDILYQLETSGIVDRSVMADATPEEVHSILGRYFSGHVDSAWAHDRTGAPVYSALFGLEIARHDLVVLMDADILFHSSGPSWVAAGVALLEQDPSLWFVMSHAGPPAGTVGTRESLDVSNRQQARWNEALRAWCFQHVSSRYFLTDRRRLRNRVPATVNNGDLETLEYCFSQALERNDAWRANLALPGNWDLHVHDHGAPFPEWAPQIAQLVERGLVPDRQRGDYDLRLRKAALRVPWRALLQREFPDLNPFAVVS